MINIVNLTRTPPPIVAAVPPLPPAPLYSQDTSPKHSIICLRRTFPSNHGSNTSIPKLLSWLDLMQHNTSQVFKQLVQGCAAVEYAGSARVERLGQGQPGETGLSHYSPPQPIYSCYILQLQLHYSTVATTYYIPSCKSLLPPLLNTMPNTMLNTVQQLPLLLKQTHTCAAVLHYPLNLINLTPLDSTNACYITRNVH